MKMRAAAIAAAVGGELVGDDVEVDGACHDSREVVGRELFVPVVDQRDGHDFIGAALAAGAAAYLTAREPQGGTAIRVADPTVALRDLGAWARGRLGERVVGITGSVGKTSCKDLAAAVLGTTFQTHASLRSFNNELGVPLTLINAADGTEAAIIEMGARGVGHIDELCAIARPTVGVVTTVEHVHTELFGDIETVALAKGELIERLPSSGTAVLNAANGLVRGMASRTDAQVLLFGEGDGSDVRAEDVRIAVDLRPAFRLATPAGTVPVELGVRGEHQVHNALAAAAVGIAYGVPLDAISAGLSVAALSPWRMELTTSPAGALVLNDAYNAGPASMEAALRSLVHLDARRRFAVLGPMAELGDHAAAAHDRTAELARDHDITIIAVDAPDYAAAGVEHVADRDAAIALLHALGVGDGDAVLVKGSRVAGLEHVAAALLHD